MHFSDWRAACFFCARVVFVRSRWMNKLKLLVGARLSPLTLFYLVALFTMYNYPIARPPPTLVHMGPWTPSIKREYSDCHETPLPKVNLLWTSLGHPISTSFEERVVTSCSVICSRFLWCGVCWTFRVWVIMNYFNWKSKDAFGTSHRNMGT